MGCNKSKNDIVEIPEADLVKLDRISRWEHSFPFYKQRIDVFEGRVKRFVMGRTGVSLEQLRYAFKDDKNWKDLNDDNSMLVTILKSEHFEDEEKGLINIHALILWALMLCGGDYQLKARVYYDVLQDSL